MTGNPVGLVEFLQQRLDERQAAAEATEHNDGPGTLEWRRGGRRNHRFDNGCSESYESVFAGEWDRILIARDSVKGGPLAEFIAANDPAYVLQDIAAKRRIIEEVQQTLLRLEWTGMYSVREEGRLLLRLLAAPFSSHPDWQPEWNTDERR